MKHVLYLVFGCFALAGTDLFAQEMSEAELDKSAYSVYQQIFSPFCPGRSLNDCPSSKAHDLKMELREQLASGVSEQEVLEDVFKKYGDKYRAIPQYAGFGKLVWWIPLGFILLGGAVVFARSTRRSPSSPNVSKQSEETIALSSELEAQIEKELSSMD